MSSVRSIYFILFFILCDQDLFAQLPATNSGGQVEQIQPSIIVIPTKKQGEKYRSLLEDPRTGFHKKIAISRVKEAFDSRGFTTYDFMAELKKNEENAQLTTDALILDMRDIILNVSKPDIFVEVDINVESGASGTDVKLILQAYETETARSLTNKDASSGKFYTEDISKLTGKAVDLIKEDFLNVLQTKFSEIVKNGRSIEVIMQIDKESTVNFQSEVGTEGDLLSEVITDWMAKNAYKNYARKGSSTAGKITYDDVRIPLKDQATGLNFELDSYGRAIRKFLRTLNVSSVIEYSRGKILVTIKNT